MAIDDDPLTIQLRQAKQELDRGIEPALAAATVAGVLSMIPGVGSAIQSLIDGRARENVARRWVELFEDLRREIERVRDRIPDARYYGSEEFQTLLALAREQLLTAHDRQKLRMLAAALAHSGTVDFESDDKELMVRILRGVNAADVQALGKEHSRSAVSAKNPVLYTSEQMTRLARLTGLGLLHEQRISGVDGGPAIGRDRIFQISAFGESFLRFVEVEASAVL